MGDWSDDDGSGSGSGSGSSLEPPARSRPSYSDDDAAANSDDDASLDDAGSFTSDDDDDDDGGDESDSIVDVGGAEGGVLAEHSAQQPAALTKPRGKELRRPLRTGETDSEEEAEDSEDDDESSGDGGGAAAHAAGYESGRDGSGSGDDSEEDSDDDDDDDSEEEDEDRPVRQVDATPQRQEPRDSFGSSSLTSPLSAEPHSPAPKGRGKELRRKPQLDTSSSESDMENFETPPPKAKAAAKAAKSKISAAAEGGKAKGSASTAKETKSENGAPIIVAPDDGTRHPSPPPNAKSREVHSGPAPDAGDGWIMKIFERNASSTCEGKLDRFWYSPTTQRKFRSLGEVRKFQAALDAVGGKDEDKAWKYFGDAKKGLVVLPKKKSSKKKKKKKKKKSKKKAYPSSEESESDEEVIAAVAIDSDDDDDDSEAVAVAVVAEPIVAEPIKSTASGRRRRSRKPSAKAIENAAGGLLDDTPGGRQKGRGGGGGDKEGGGGGGSSKKKTPSKATGGRGGKTPASSAKRKKSKSKSKSKKKAAHDSDSDSSSSSSSSAAAAGPTGGKQFSPPAPEVVASAIVVPAEKLDAAERARAVLRSTVPALPAALSTTHTVRNLGRIKIEGDTVVDAGPDGAAALAEALFSSANALHPVGYSCDRYEFSPTHGRVLKMRCDILDGSAVRKRREERERGERMASEKKPPQSEEGKGGRGKKKTQGDDDDLERHDGPIFRIMWGEGIDADTSDAVSFPFDVFSSSPPLGSGGADVDAIAVPIGEGGGGNAAASGGGIEAVKPEAGMRVSVRFDHDEWYGGVISKVSKKDVDASGNKKKGTPSKKKGGKGGGGSNAGSSPAGGERRYGIKIRYDDGAKEEAVYPDPDIVLRPPGAEGPGLGDRGEVNPALIRGAPVSSVAGRTAIEAWGKALCRLGLIDEVMLDAALGALETGRKEGIREAQNVMELKKKQRQEARARSAQRQKEREGSISGSLDGMMDDARSVASDMAGGTPQKEKTSAVTESNGDTENGGADDGSREAPSLREEELRRKIEALSGQYDAARSESRTLTDNLTSLRITTNLGPFLLNPFQAASSQQKSSWLQTVVRKEKTRMGSTGSKRKIVAATDLLERNNTFFDDDIEKLVEGLPGTEFCPGYVFKNLRAGGAAGASFAWVHEAEIKHEKERQKVLQKKEKETKEAKKKETVAAEREAKRKAKDEERDARKRQKLEEEEARKKAREEDRLNKLATAVDNRLFKEACFQREKVVVAAAKATSKEFMRRRKAAEILAGHAAEKMLEADEQLGGVSVVVGAGALTAPAAAANATDEAFLRELPPLSARLYDGDVLRLWDFVSSFGDVFGAFTSIPSLDALHDALRALRRRPRRDSTSSSSSADDAEEDDAERRKEATDLLSSLAMALCRPLATDLVKLLSSVTVTAAGAAIAAPAMDKIGGPGGGGPGAFDLKAYIARQNGAEDGDDSNSSPEELHFDCFSVTSITWREVARCSLLEDMLTEFGFSKQECAHTLRGFRSGGHPNSKEAKRLRRGEDLALSMLRQTVSEGAERIRKRNGNGNGGAKFNVIKVKVTAPCKPSATPSDWTFYLHNVKSLPPNAATAIKANLRKALALLNSRKSSKGEDGVKDEPKDEAKSTDEKKKKKEELDSIQEELQRALGVFEQIGTSAFSSSHETIAACTRARTAVLKVLDKRTGELYSSDAGGTVFRDDVPLGANDNGTSGTSSGGGASGPPVGDLADKPHVRLNTRERMGIIKSMLVSKEQYKQAVREKDAYILAAQHEIDRKKREASGEVEDDDDEDDDDDDEVKSQASKSDIAGDGAKKPDEKPSVNNDGEKTSKIDGEGDGAKKPLEEKKTSNNDSSEKASKSDGDDGGEEKSGASNGDDGNEGEKNLAADKATTPTAAVAATATAVTATAVTASSATATAATTAVVVDDGRIGKPTPHDAFCGDDPAFPDLIRRCLAVLRTVCNSPSSQPFLYPVDPSTNARYYELVVRPISLQDVGRKLQRAGKRLSNVAKAEKAENGATSSGDEMSVDEPSEEVDGTKAKAEATEEMESLVAQLARDIRQISSNCSCISNVGAALISSADEMLRIFERLLFDWCLVPPTHLPPLIALDDDKCVDHHPSDEEYPVLLCDGCEGKYNMGRLDPPLTKVPQGDWYCPRCTSGRCWNHVDPRIGRSVRRRFNIPRGGDGKKGTKAVVFNGKIKSSLYHKAPNGKSGLSYVVKYGDGDEEIWSLSEIDAALLQTGNPAPRVACVEAVAESPGYGSVSGPDKGLHAEPVPAYVNPLVSDLAARAIQSNTLFRDQLGLTLTLAFTSPQELTSEEWLRLLVLLATKCSASDVLQDWQSQLEAQSAERMAERISRNNQGGLGAKSVYEILPRVTDDEGGSSGDEESSAAGGGSSVSGKSGSDGNSQAGRGQKRKKPVLFGDESDSEEDEHPAPPPPEEGGGKRKRSISAGSKASASSKASDAIKLEGAELAAAAATVVAATVPKEIDGAAVKADHAAADATGAETAAAAAAIVKGEAASPAPKLSEEQMRRKHRSRYRAARLRARDDCLSAVAVKAQMRSTIAAFEEDGFSNVVDSTLGAKNKQITLAATRCRGTFCDFCGLPDTALGAALVRVPNQEEWRENTRHAGAHRMTHMVAEVFDADDYADMQREKDAAESEAEAAEAAAVAAAAAEGGPDAVPSSEAAVFVKQEKKQPPRLGQLKVVTVRVNGELISDKLEHTDDVPERGMLEFLPRNPAGMQYDLRCRDRDSLPVMTGSSSAHNCCAIAAHRARKEATVKQHKDRAEAHADLDHARECGRTLAIGSDQAGRGYWKFHADPDSLFVLDDSSGGGKKRWHRFSEPETVASVIVCLGRGPSSRLAAELRRLYPVAAEMVRSREWVGLLQKRAPVALLRQEEEDEHDEDCAEVPQKKTLDAIESDNAVVVDEDDEESGEEQEPYDEGEEVLVESASGKLLWKAKVLAVSKNRETDKVKAYRVHYKEWGSRFDEWVGPMRVVEPSDNNLIVQGEMLDEFHAAREKIPALLKDMACKSFLKAKGRARGAVPLPDLGAIVSVGPGASLEEKVIRNLKAGLLMIEVALPNGAVDTSSEGLWSPARAECWRGMVTNASGPATLVGCVVLLESAISAEFFHPKAYSLISCLPRHWKAISEASTATVALRIKTLDRGIKYGERGGKAKKGK